MSKPDWQPIETYPHCGCDGGWGPGALLRFEIKGQPEMKVVQVGWLEAGMWFYRDPDDPVCCGEFNEPPVAWADIGDTWECPKQKPPIPDETHPSE